MPTRLTKEEKEAIEWTQKHRAVAERRTRMLKGTGIFLLFVAIGIAIVLALVVAAVLLVAAFAFAIAAFAFAIVLIVALIYTPDNIYTPDKYGREAVVGIISGVSIGIVLALIYIVPQNMALDNSNPFNCNIKDNSITTTCILQVFYPNQSNITITQNCTAFTTSSSGYFNGQPINPQNTPMASIAQYPISICTGTPPGQNVTWQGTILNVSTR